MSTVQGPQMLPCEMCNSRCFQEEAMDEEGMDSRG